MPRIRLRVLPEFTRQANANTNITARTDWERNSLVSCIFGGGLAGTATVKYSKSLEKGAESTASGVLIWKKNVSKKKNQKLISQDGTENPITIWRELGDVMTEHVTVTRINKNLEMADGKIRTLQERYKKINLSDRTKWSNQTLNFARELENMIVLARVITRGALARNESRGAHYKPDFPGPRTTPIG